MGRADDVGLKGAGAISQFSTNPEHQGYRPDIVVNPLS
jgi:hypothetical protein